MCQSITIFLSQVYKKSCEYVKSGYGTEKVGVNPLCSNSPDTPTQVCSNKPVKECDTRPKTVFKKLPDTTCERIPFEACAPDNCKSLLFFGNFWSCFDLFWNGYFSVIKHPVALRKYLISNNGKELIIGQVFQEKPFLTTRQLTFLFLFHLSL